MATRRKRGSLPDLWARGYRFPEAPRADGTRIEQPSAAIIAALTEKYGFPADFDLPKELDRVWEWWRIDVQLGADPSASVRRKFLRETARRAAALEQAIEFAGGAVRRLRALCGVRPELRRGLRNGLTECASRALVRFAAAMIEPRVFGCG